MSTNDLDDEMSCGGRVVVSYIWVNNKLIYSGIAHRTNKNILHDFPTKGHFMVKATKALVRTSHKHGAFTKPGDCSLRIRKYEGAPNVTKADIEAVTRECELPVKQKRRQMKKEFTYPVLVEKSKVKNVFAELFPPRLSTTYPYKANESSLMYTEFVREMSKHEVKCNTVNVVECHPPLVLYYGSGYAYYMHLKPTRAGKLNPAPTVIVVFYGEIYETPNEKFTGHPLDYFSGLIPEPYETDDPKLNKEFAPRLYESDIDDYAFDTSEDEEEDRPKNLEYETDDYTHDTSDDEEKDAPTNPECEEEGVPATPECEAKNESENNLPEEEVVKSDNNFEKNENKQENKNFEKQAKSPGNDEHQEKPTKLATWADIASTKPKNKHDAASLWKTLNIYHNQ